MGLPTLTPLDESVHILEKTVEELLLKIAQLKARQKPIIGKSVPVIHPVTGRIGNGPIKRNKRKPATV